MSSSDMDAATRSIQLSASGSLAASACVTGRAGDPVAAARARVGDRSMPSTRRPAASNGRPARPSPQPKSMIRPAESGKTSSRAGQVPFQKASS
jgi:hypothetical protein